MYNKIIDNLSSDLDELFEATKNNPTRHLFGLSFEDYDTWLELANDARTGKADPDQKWMDKIEKTVNEIKKNKREWKKFISAYDRGNWQDYIYDVEVDDKGNWKSTKRKLKGDELKRRKKLYK